MTKKGKITVKHYLNTRLKPIKEKKYPIYLQISVLGKTTQVKSEVIKPQITYSDLENGDFTYDDYDLAFQGYVTEKHFEHLLNNEDDKYGKRLQLERKSIVSFIELVNPFDKNNFTIGGFNSAYSSMTRFFLWDFQEDLRSVLSGKILSSKFSPLSNLLELYDNNFYGLYLALKCIKDSSLCDVPAVSFIFRDLESAFNISNVIKQFTDNKILLTCDLFTMKDDLIRFVQSSDQLNESDLDTIEILKYSIQNMISRIVKSMR